MDYFLSMTDKGELDKASFVGVKRTRKKGPLDKNESYNFIISAKK